MMAPMRLGPEGRDSGWKMPPPAQVAGTLIAAAFVLLAMGLARMSNSGGDSGDGLTSPLAQSATASGDDDDPAEIPASQPAVPVSFSASGEVIRTDPETNQSVDPETDEGVGATLPPGGTGSVPPPVTGSTSPGSGTTATTARPPSTTAPPTTQPPTTEPPTTAPPTTSTTLPDPTTTTTVAEGQGVVGGLLDGVGGLLGL